MATIIDCFVEYMKASLSTDAIRRADEYCNELLRSMNEGTKIPGYQSYLMTKKVPLLAAWGLSKLASRVGKRKTNDAKWRLEACRAVRYIAGSKKSGKILNKKVCLLLDAWDDSSVLDDLFPEELFPENNLIFEFVSLLKACRDGDMGAVDHLRRLAQQAQSHLQLPRGPSISEHSATHEAFLYAAREVEGVHHYTYDPYAEEVTGPLTEAARAEFRDPDFDPRPALRRYRRSEISRGK